MRASFPAPALVVDANTPRPFFLPAHVERKIAARWREWEPWVLIDLKHRNLAPDVESAEFARLRRMHSRHVLTLLRVGIAMRLIRRHQLDDPRITDEERTTLMQ